MVLGATCGRVFWGPCMLLEDRTRRDRSCHSCLLSEHEQIPSLFPRPPVMVLTRTRASIPYHRFRSSIVGQIMCSPQDPVMSAW